MRFKKYKKDSVLELVTQGDAVKEGQIAAHVKVIHAAIKGNKRARNLFFAYAAIAGAHANALMELAPHGQGEKLLEQHFGDAARSTLYNWRQFATNIAERLAKSPTVGLLTAPSLSKKAIPAKAAESIQEAVVEAMDEQGMVEFMRSCKALKDASKGERGGDRTLLDKEQIAQWCAEYHPDMPAAKCEAAVLKGPLKKDFQKWEANQPQPPPPYDDLARNDMAVLDEMSGQPARHNGCLVATLNDWIERAEHLVRTLKEAKGKRKNKAEPKTLIETLQ